MKHSTIKKRGNKNHSLSLDFATPIAKRGYILDTEKRQLVSQIFNMISEQEKRVLTLKSIGYEYHEIAEEIQVSTKTAESIMENLRRRIIARFPAVAAVYGVEVVSYAH